MATKAEIIESLKTARSRGERPSVLWGANLWGADLWGADLRGADLRDANLWGADLWGADLRDANLRGADLRDANLWDADLRDANLPQGSVVRALGETPSGLAMIQPTPEGWLMSVGCWRGTPEALRELIAKDTGWPEARGDQVAERRPFLENVLTLADWHIAENDDVLPSLATKWADADAKPAEVATTPVKGV